MRDSFKNKLPIFFYFLIILATLSSKVIKVKAVPNNVLLEVENFTLAGLSSIKTDDSSASGNSYVEFSQPTNNSSFQPTAPYYAAFYYPWYKNATTDVAYSYWNDHTNTPPTTWFSHYLPDPKPNVFDPATELYSANDYTNFKWQVSKMAEAKLEVAISSWWGINTKEDIAFKNIINTFMPKADNPYPNLRWAMYYEKEGFRDPSLTELTADLNHIKTNYINSKYYLKVSNKPVIFVYGGAEDDIATTQTATKRWKDANASVGNTFYIVLKVFAGYTADPYQPDNWHQYAPAVRSGFYGTSSAFVSPGFWLDDVPTTDARLGRNLTEFKTEITKMVAGNYMWKLVETWNEWGEGTSVEPGQETSKDVNGKEILNPNGTPFGNSYIDALNQALPALESGTGYGNVMITPSPVANPTPTPSIATTPTPVVSVLPTVPVTNCATLIPIDSAGTTFTNSQNGNYKIWIRAKSTSTSIPNIWVKTDNYCNKLDTSTVNQSSWNWVSNTAQFTISAGTKPISILSDTGGIKIDNVLLTSDLTCSPSSPTGNCANSLDFDGNTRVELADAITLIKKIFDDLAPVSPTSNPDINNDGKINLIDVVLFLQAYFF